MLGTPTGKAGVGKLLVAVASHDSSIVSIFVVLLRVVAGLIVAGVSRESVELLVIVCVWLSLSGLQEFPLLLVEVYRLHRVTVAPPKLLLEMSQSFVDKPNPQLVLALRLILQVLPQDDLLPVRPHRRVKLGRLPDLLLQARLELVDVLL